MASTIHSKVDLRSYILLLFLDLRSDTVSKC